jgi:hypothetical protein
MEVKEGIGERMEEGESTEVERYDCGRVGGIGRWEVESWR